MLSSSFAFCLLLLLGLGVAEPLHITLSSPSSFSSPLQAFGSFSLNVTLSSAPVEQILVSVRVVARGFPTKCTPLCLSPETVNLTFTPGGPRHEIITFTAPGDAQLPGHMYLVTASSVPAVEQPIADFAIGWIGAVDIWQNLTEIFCDDELPKSYSEPRDLFVHREIFIRLPYPPPAGTRVTFVPRVEVAGNKSVAVVSPSTIEFSGDEPVLEKGFWVSCTDPLCAASDDAKAKLTLDIEDDFDGALSGRLFNNSAASPWNLNTLPLLSAPCPEEFYRPAEGQALKFFCPNTQLIRMPWLIKNTVADVVGESPVSVNLEIHANTTSQTTSNNASHWISMTPPPLNGSSFDALITAKCGPDEDDDDDEILLVRFKTILTMSGKRIATQSWPSQTNIFIGKCPDGRGIANDINKNMCVECPKGEAVLGNRTCGPCPNVAMVLKEDRCVCINKKIDIPGKPPRDCMQCAPGYFWVSIISPCRSCHGGLQIALLLGYSALLVAYAYTEIRYPPNSSGSLRWTYFHIAVQVIQLAALSAVPIPEYETGRVMGLFLIDLTAIWLPCMVSQGPIVLVLRLLLPLLTLGCAVVIPKLPGFLKSVKNEVAFSLSTLTSPLTSRAKGQMDRFKERLIIPEGDGGGDGGGGGVGDSVVDKELIKVAVKDMKDQERAAVRSVWTRLLWTFSLPVLATSLEVFDCIPDTGKEYDPRHLYLRSNPRVHCSMDNVDYMVMMVISVSAIILMAVAVPLKYLAVTLARSKTAEISHTRYRLWTLLWHSFRFSIAFAVYLSHFGAPIRKPVDNNPDKGKVDYDGLRSKFKMLIAVMGVLTPVILAATALLRPWGPLVRGKQSPAYLAFAVLLIVNVPSFFPKRNVSWSAWAVGFVVILVMGAHGVFLYLAESRNRMRLLREELMGEVDKGTNFLMPRRLLALLCPVPGTPGLLEISVPANANSDARLSEAHPAYAFVSVIAEELAGSGAGESWSPVLTRVVFRYNRTLARAFRERLRILGRREPLGREWPKDGRQAEREAVRAVLQSRHLERMRSIVQRLSEDGDDASADPGLSGSADSLFSSSGSLTNRTRGKREASSLHGMADVITDSEIARAGLSLVWHGSSGGLPTIDSICRTGFINLSLLNKGFHGRGYYLTGSPAYAAYYVLHGGHSYANMTTDREVPVLLAWTLVGTAYPVLEKMTDQHDFPVDPFHAGYPGHDSHYALVGDRGVTCTSYLPTPTFLYDEICCFQESQTLPIAVVYFQFGAK